jgi:hypothetical protein
MALVYARYKVEIQSLLVAEKRGGRSMDQRPSATTTMPVDAQIVIRADHQGVLTFSCYNNVGDRKQWHGKWVRGLLSRPWLLVSVAQPPHTP